MELRERAPPWERSRSVLFGKPFLARSVSDWSPHVLLCGLSVSTLWDWEGAPSWKTRIQHPPHSQTILPFLVSLSVKYPPCNTEDDHQRAVTKRLNCKSQIQTQLLRVREGRRGLFIGAEAPCFPGERGPELSNLIFQGEPEIQIFMWNILICKCWQLISLKFGVAETKPKENEGCVRAVYKLCGQPSTSG